MNMSKKLNRLAILLTVFLFVLTACTSSNVPDAGSAANTDTADVSDTDAAPDADADRGDVADVAVIFKVLSEEFYQDMQTGIEEEAARQGLTVDFYACNSADDVEGQLVLLENCIQKGYKAIGICPMSPDNCNMALAEATKNGIYVVNIDDMLNMESLRSFGGAVYAHVGTDNVEAGRVGGQYIVDAVTAGKVAIIEGKAGVSGGEDRKAGAIAAFEAADGIELVESQPADWDRTRAYDIATNYLSKHPDLKGIYCANGIMALGALEAAKNEGSDVVITCTNADEEVVIAIRNGEIAATAAQDAVGIGISSMAMIAEALSSGVPLDPDAEVIAVGVDVTLITQENAG